MTLPTLGILSPGEMGAAMARSFKAHGAEVLCALNGRSDRTKAMATAAGITNVGSIDQLVRQCDVILSVIAPGAAVVAAQQVSAAMQATSARPVFVDCNSIAPQTSRKVGDFIAAAGGRFLDAALLGVPPGGTETVRLYVCGPDAESMLPLETDHVRVHVLGSELGTASGLRMCYQAFGEGIAAMATEILVAAERFGVALPLRSELIENQGTAFEWVLRVLPDLLVRAPRAVKEMEEAALAFESAGLSPRPMIGIAEVLRWLADTSTARNGAKPSREAARELIERLGKT